MIKYLTGITRASSSEADRTAAIAVVQTRSEEFFSAKDRTKKMDQTGQTKFVNFLLKFCSKPKDLDLTPNAVLVVKAYFPTPLDQFTDFDDCIMDELNNVFAESGMLAQQIENTFADLDAGVWDLMLDCKFKANKVAKNLQESFKDLALELKKANKRGRVHVFVSKTKPPTFELAALVKKDTSKLSKIAAFFGADTGRVSLEGTGVAPLMQAALCTVCCTRFQM